MLSVMALGPLELIVLSFPCGQDSTTASWRHSTRLLGAPGVRVLDVLVVRTDAVGGACPVELNELPGIGGDPLALARLATGSSPRPTSTRSASSSMTKPTPLAVLVEHQWVNDLASDVASTDGTVLRLLHIPVVTEDPRERSGGHRRKVKGVPMDDLKDIQEMGPVDYLCIEFPPGSTPGQGLPHLVSLVGPRHRRDLDLRFLRKTRTARSTSWSASSWTPGWPCSRAPPPGCWAVTTSRRPPRAGAGSAAALIVYENVWAARSP
jgi:hypothetical protein